MSHAKREQRRRPQRARVRHLGVKSATDFVKCTDPLCPRAIIAAERAHRFPRAKQPGPHCHPVF